MRATGQDRRLRALEARIGKLGLPKAVEETFAPYRADVGGFLRDVLGVTSATRRSDGTPYQLEVLESVQADPRTVVVAGHGVGKSTLDAWVALWWQLTRPMSRVVVVAPEFQRQIKAVLFAEMRRWVRRSRIRLPLSVMSNRVVVEGYGDEWGCIGVPATEPERIEGFHAEGGLLLILDECKGIGQDVVDAMQGALTGGDDSRLLVTSTPGGPSGPLWKAWNALGTWRKFHLPSPNSSQVAPAWVEDRRREWGEDSPLYKARVLGIFPDEADGTLFPLALLEAAVARDLEGEGAVVMGVDVARSVAGDQNCVAVARGGKLERLVLWRSPDTMITVSRVLEEVLKVKPTRVRCDSGGVGAGVADRLRQMGVPVEDVHFGGGAQDAQRFKNARAEGYWALREGLEAGKVSLPDDEELLADLSAIRYVFTQDGKIQLEDKDAIRTRLGRSTDRADGAMLAIASGLTRMRVLPASLGLEDLQRPPQRLDETPQGGWRRGWQT